ncbi:MAG TPA: MFS transporter [Candidatus Aquilonibacter sp.]|nr:MFS transporter [Candidatus Aquilonibacter sp.]
MPSADRLTSQAELHSSIEMRKRWPIALLLAFGVLVNFLDRINLSVSREALNASFGISLVAFGYLSSAYSWTYALMQMPAGVLLDRFGIRRVGRVSIVLWSVACFAAALAPGIGWFLMARLLLGISESPTFPANAKAIGSWFPSEERSLAMAVTDSAAKFSMAIGVPVLGLLLIHFGWRWSFAATGFASVFYFVLFYRIYRDPPENLHALPERIASHETEGLQIHESGRGVSLGYLLRQPKVYGLALGWGAYNYTFFVLLNWLPSYLSLSLRVDLLHSVLYTSVPWLIAGVSDLLIGGWLVDGLIQRGWNANRVRQSVMLGGMGLGLAILGTARATTPLAALICISIALAGLAAMAPVAWTIPSLISPGNAVGAIGGIVNFCGQIAAISAPIVTGYIVSATHSFAPAFAVSTAVLVSGILGFVFLLGRIERIAEPEEK